MSAFTQGLQTANALLDDAVTGIATGTTGQTDIAVAHGLSAAPDFVLLGGNGSADEVAAGIQWAATATTLTITVNDTAAPKVIAYIAAKL